MELASTTGQAYTLSLSSLLESDRFLRLWRLEIRRRPIYPVGRRIHSAQGAR